MRTATPLALLALALPSMAQDPSTTYYTTKCPTHGVVHHSMGDNHNHSNKGFRRLDFGIIQKPAGVGGQVSVASLPGSRVVVDSSTNTANPLRIMNHLVSGPAVQCLTVTDTQEPYEKYWRVMPRNRGVETVTLNRVGGGGSIVVTMGAPNPSSGQYPHPGVGDATMFGWGGFATIPTNAPAGTYTGSTEPLPSPNNMSSSYKFTVTQDACTAGYSYGWNSSDFNIQLVIQDAPPVALSVATTMLEFGGIISPPSTIQVVVGQTGTRTSPNGAQYLVTMASLPPKNGTMTVTGTAGRSVHYLVPSSIELISGASRMTAALSWSLPAGTASGTDPNAGWTTPIAPDQGTPINLPWFTFPGTGSGSAQVTLAVGGTLTVNAGQAPGRYIGNAPVTIAYR